MKTYSEMYSRPSQTYKKDDLLLKTKIETTTSTDVKPPY